MESAIASAITGALDHIGLSAMARRFCRPRYAVQSSNAMRRRACASNSEETTMERKVGWRGVAGSAVVVAAMCVMATYARAHCLGGPGIYNGCQLAACRDA